MGDRLNVAISGYVGSGSSAVIDLLREYDCGIALDGKEEYEHTLFYVDNGLFDLGQILMNSNTPLRSDTAISSFLESMHWLNHNNFGWFGSYQNILGDQFMEMIESFVSEISQKIDGSSYSHYKYVKTSKVKMLLQAAAKIVYKRPIQKWGRTTVLDHKQMYFSMPTPEEYYGAARKLIQSYFEMCVIENKTIMIYDHLICPQQVGVVEEYFDKDFKLIIVDRDARDLYTLNKHYWYHPSVGSGKPVFPTDIHEFIDYWQRVRRYNMPYNTSKIMHVQFEELVYNYEETVDQIECFLGLEKKQHLYKKQFFDPEKSIKNTQTYLIKAKWQQEAQMIKIGISEYTYDFPFRSETSKSEMFI